MTALMASKKKTLTLATCALSLGLGTALHAQEPTAESKAQAERPQSSAEQQQHLPTRVRVSQGVMATLLIKKVPPEYPKVPPEYPKEAHKKHIQGTVILHVVISKEGDVAEVSVVSGDPMLTESAIEAAKQWKYKPYLLNGEPVEVETQFQLNFVLSGN